MRLNSTTRDRSRLPSLLGNSRALIVLLMLAPPVQAHGLHVDRGRVTIQAQAVTITIEHTPHPGTSPPDHFEHLRQALIVRDQQGLKLKLLKSTMEPPRQDGSFSCELTYAIESPTALLLFQYVPRSGPPVRRQIVLAVNAAGQAQPHTLRLTSGGNVEYVDLTGSSAAQQHGACLSYTQRDVSRFHEVIVEIERRGTEWVARVHAPLTLLLSYGFFEEATDDWLSVDQQLSNLPKLEQFMTGALTLSQPARRLTPTLEDIAFCSATSDCSGTKPANVWTTSLRAQLSWHADSPAHIRWNAFNGTVLNVRLVTLKNENCTEQTLSTFAPSVILQ